MGHGGVNPSNAAYGALQLKLQDAKMKNIFIFTVEGYPSFENLKETLKRKENQKSNLNAFDGSSW